MTKPQQSLFGNGGRLVTGSRSRIEDKKPPPPDQLVGARHDSVHVDVGRSRPAKVIRHRRAQFTHLDMVRAVMSKGAWWTLRTLREAVLVRFGADVEAVSSRIRELRAIGKKAGFVVEAEHVPGKKHWRYRMVS